MNDKVEHLRNLVGEEAFQALNDGRQYLHIWTRTVPCNVWVGNFIDDSEYPWHSQRGERPHMSLFEEVELPEDNYYPGYYIYKLKPEFRVKTKTTRKKSNWRVEGERGGSWRVINTFTEIPYGCYSSRDEARRIKKDLDEACKTSP